MLTVFEGMAYIYDMTLHEVLQAYGITPKLLTQRLGCSRQFAHKLYHAKPGLGRRLGTRVAQAFDVPLVHVVLPETITPDDVAAHLDGHNRPKQ
jgi:hypothetical protein